MSLVFDVASWLCLCGGAFFCIVGAIGMLRMPDFYARTHPASMVDTMGAGLILLGLTFQAGLTLITVKLVIVFLLLLISSPTATHALVKAAYAHNMRVQTSEEDAGHAD